MTHHEHYSNLYMLWHLISVPADRPGKDCGCKWYVLFLLIDVVKLQRNGILLIWISIRAMYLWIYVCMCVCVCVYIYIYIHTHTHTHTYIHIHIYTYTCARAHTHTHNLIKPELSLTKIIFECHDFCMELTFHTSSVNHLLHIG